MSEPASGAATADSDVGTPAPEDVIAQQMDEEKEVPTTPPPDTFERSQHYFYFTQEDGSPSKRDTIMTDTTHKDKNARHREAGLKELGKIHVVPTSYFDEKYKDVVAPEKMDAYFATRGEHVDGRWARLPPPDEPVDNKSRFCGPYVGICNSVFDHFHPSLPSGVTRQAIDTSKLRMTHDNPNDWTSPDISVRAEGPSFETPKGVASKNRNIGYSNFAAVFGAKKDKGSSNSKTEHVKQAAVWIRQIFLHQPNRVFACTLIVTEERCRIIHFDRSGVYVTPMFNIHDDYGKRLLVKCILVFTSPDEALMGLDTTIQWTIKDGKKITGTITVTTEDEDEGNPQSVFTTKTYNLKMDEPPFVRPGVRGRGTVAWSANDPVTGDDVLIKDSWRSAGRYPEWMFLSNANEAPAVPGIPQLLAYEDYVAETIHFRPSEFGNSNAKAKLEDFFNRIKSRLVMPKYGKSIWFFRTRLQFLRALLSAIVAHHELYARRNILHRDIAVPNILLGRPDADPGFNGILADLDMAICIYRPMDYVSKDPRSAYRFYQSIGCLLAPEGKPQNYLDDLEGFFYSCHHVMRHFKQPGVRVQKLDPSLQDFRQETTIHAVNAKLSLFIRAPQTYSLSPYWGGACVTLYREFHQVVREMCTGQEAIRRSDKSDDEMIDAMKEFSKTNAKSYYTRIVAAFDKAINTLVKEGPNAEELEPYPANPEPFPLNRPPDEIPGTAGKAVLTQKKPDGPDMTRPKELSASIRALQARHNAARAMRHNLKRPSEHRTDDPESSKRVKSFGQSSRGHPADMKNTELTDAPELENGE